MHTHLACGSRGFIQARTPVALRGLVVKDPLHTDRLALQEDPSAVESGSQVTDGRDTGIYYLKDWPDVWAFRDGL